MSADVSHDLFKIRIQNFKTSESCREEINEYLKCNRVLVKSYKLQTEALELLCARNCDKYHQVQFNVYRLVCVVVHNEASVVSYTNYCYNVHNKSSYMLKFTEHSPTRYGWEVYAGDDEKN